MAEEQENLVEGDAEMQAEYAFTSGQRGKYAHIFRGKGKTACRSVVEVLADTPGHVLFEAAEEVEAHLQEERDAWED